MKRHGSRSFRTITFIASFVCMFGVVAIAQGFSGAQVPTKGYEWQENRSGTKVFAASARRAASFSRIASISAGVLSL